MHKPMVKIVTLRRGEGEFQLNVKVTLSVKNQFGDAPLLMQLITLTVSTFRQIEHINSTKSPTANV